MKRIYLICCVLLTIGFNGYAQEQSLGWLNDHVKPVNPDTSDTLSDLSFLSTELKDNIVVGLGEASHGTREFYNHKRRIIEYLITRLEYKRLAFEFGDSLISPINQYLISGKGDLKSMMAGFMLYNTEEIFKVFEFIATFNKNKTPLNKVQVYGFDQRDFAANPFTRDQYMAAKAISAQTDSQLKTILWAHNVHLAKDTTMAKFKAMGYYLKEKYNKAYYVIGFDTYSGSVNVISDGKFIAHPFVANEESLANLFAKVKYDRFFVSFKNVNNRFLTSQHQITNIYSNWTSNRSLPIVPFKDFDALIFIKTTTASVRLR